MKNSLFQKWSLFISSYLPLYMLLFFTNIEYDLTIVKQIIGNWEYFLVLTILIIISVIQIISLLIGNGSEVEILPSDITISVESESLMNYIITYILPILSLDISDKVSIITNGVCFFIIGCLYVGSSTTFLNPILGLLGYKVFMVNNYPGRYCFISRLSFDEFELVKENSKEVLMYRIGEGVYTLKNKK